MAKILTQCEKQVVKALPDRSQVRAAVRAILDYLTEHPHARDTSRGIAEWWSGATNQATEEALSFLLEKGFLQRSQRNGQVLFGRNPDISPAQLRHLLDHLQAE